MRSSRALCKQTESEKKDEGASGNVAGCPGPHSFLNCLATLRKSWTSSSLLWPIWAVSFYSVSLQRLDHMGPQEQDSASPLDGNPLHMSPEGTFHQSCRRTIVQRAEVEQDQAIIVICRKLESPMNVDNTTPQSMLPNMGECMLRRQCASQRTSLGSRAASQTVTKHNHLRL